MIMDFVTIKQVAQAVASGTDVRWSNDNYHVTMDGLDQFHITYRPGTREANSVGLFWQDGETSDYNPADFYIKRD